METSAVIQPGSDNIMDHWGEVREAASLLSEALRMKRPEVLGAAMDLEQS